MQLKPITATVVLLLVVASLLVSGCTSSTSNNTTTTNSPYQFTTGVVPPQAVNDLTSYGTAVLLINQRNCTACDEANPKFADLQMQYKDTNVRFATFNLDDNSTSRQVASAYAVNVTPTILVIREDGAFAKFIVPPPYPSTALIDFNAVKGAIDEAQSTATHDAFLGKYLAAYKSVTHSLSNQRFTAWEVTWINGTSARLQLAYVNTSTNRTASDDITYIVFPTTQDATNYLNAMNKTAYSLASTTPRSGGAFQLVTGHAPRIYKAYEWNEGNQYDISAYKWHQIEQLDNLVTVTTGKWLTTA